MYSKNQVLATWGLITIHDPNAQSNLQGNVDLSADVDFSALKYAASKIEGLDCLGPITQGEFLMEMGIEARLISLLKSAKDDAAKDDLINAANRLVDPEVSFKLSQFSTVAS